MNLCNFIGVIIEPSTVNDPPITKTGLWDDGNRASGDGCSSTCNVETGFLWKRESIYSIDTCTEICGDGIRFSTSDTSWDDANKIDGDGCNSLWTIEVGWSWSGGSSSTEDTWAEIWGDSKRFNSISTYWDDGNVISEDGCSSSCLIEIGWTWSGGSVSTKDTWTEIWSDGRRFNSLTAYWDDGNNVNGDGWSSTWAIESGWKWLGGSTATSDVWSDIWGDGKVAKSITNYCDDGNTSNGDGWNSSCNTEAGWKWVGGSISSPSVCSENWGDGITIIHNSVKWDDGNVVNGDGCSSTCSIESGWRWVGGSSISTDVWTINWGDGIYISSGEQCDDGNTKSGDGWSQAWKIESGFSWTTSALNNPATKWQEICGDGKRISSTGCDDGNTLNEDGCSSTWEVEPGYFWQGGSPVSPDICIILCGDGKNYSNDQNEWDDGNNIDGDGCSSQCKVEPGFKCVHTSSTPDVCTEICGDGRRISLTGCDDGNTQNGDGWNSNCQIESGFNWSGGSSIKRDTCFEKWGDGRNYRGIGWDDSNNVNGDGWSSVCEYETWYEWKGGTSTSPDVCSLLEISASIGTVSTDNSVDILFNHTMFNTTIELNDLYVQIDSSSSISISWSAAYTNATVLHLKTNVNQVLQGTEILKVKFINNKVFRGPNGGCIKPNSLNATMPNSLASSLETASSASSLLKYIIMVGILLIIGGLLLIGSSLEFIWSLINTLQLVSYLPLMVPNYPQHVQKMFELLGFTNLDIEIISNLVKNALKLNNIITPSLNPRFSDNGIANSLFLSNCSSILFSLFLSILTLLICTSLYSLLWWSKLKIKISNVLSSYFFNNFLRFFTEGYLEIYFGALLNVIAYDFESPVKKASFAVSCIVLVLFVLFPFMTAALIYDKRKQIRDKHPIYLKRFGTMYSNFKLKGSWFWIQYYPIFLLRRFIFVNFIIIAVNYPEFQCNSFILFSVLVSFMLIKA